MADKKISALTGAATPLAGTEVLPVVQSGATVKVAVSDLTSGRAVAVGSLASSGNIGAVNTSPTAPLMVNTYVGSEPTYRGDAVINSPGASLASNGGVEFKVDTAGSGFGARLLNYYPGSGSTYNFAIQLRNNSASWSTYLDVLATGDVKVNTGNLVQGTAAKGVNFTANTPAAGMTSQLLNWYEEGTWTPNQGAGLTLVGAFSSAGTYTRIGRQVFIKGSVSGATSVAVASAGAITTNLPYSAAADATGTAINAANNASSILRVSSATLTAATAIAATTTITFSAVYSV